MIVSDAVYVSQMTLLIKAIRDCSFGIAFVMWVVGVFRR